MRGERDSKQARPISVVMNKRDLELIRNYLDDRIDTDGLEQLNRLSRSAGYFALNVSGNGPLPRGISLSGSFK